jgi:hypothetical protein
MPLNTRVGRCVTKLKKKYGYGKSIGICQYSTKQNYLTGKHQKHKKRTKKRTKERNRKRTKKRNNKRTKRKPKKDKSK